MCSGYSQVESALELRRVREGQQGSSAPSLSSWAWKVREDSSEDFRHGELRAQGAWPRAPWAGTVASAYMYTHT